MGRAGFTCVVKSHKRNLVSRIRFIALLLALVTVMIYSPVVRHDFLNYDDDDYVTNNRIVQAGLTPAGIGWAFTTFHTGNWHPLAWISHMADCQLFGLSAGLHHLVNVLFHASNAALLFLLLNRLTQKIWPSAFVAALFAWHPLHVESVAWIAERKDVLSTFFEMLALLSYVRYVQAKCRRSFWFALGFFFLGLLAKPMVVTLPCILLLLDFWPLQRFSKNGFCWPLVREKIPFCLLAGASCVVTFLAQNAGHAVVSIDQLPLESRLGNAAAATVEYLLKIFWPADLAVIYPRNYLPHGMILPAVLVLAFVSAVAWSVRKRQPCWLVGWLWFLVTLVPVIGLVQVGATSMADRYTYFPAIGIFIAAVFGLRSLPWGNKILLPGAILSLLACIFATEHQLAFWRNSESLFRHTLAVTEENEFARINLGLALELQDRPAEALVEYREAARINPNHYQIHFAIGNMLEKTGDPANALVEYRQCLLLNPEVPALHNAVGVALAALGRFDEALKELTEAERLDPHYSEPHLQKAKIFFGLNNDAKAVEELRRATQAQPDSIPTLIAAAHYLAANTNAAARDGQAALALALRANELSDGRQPEVFDALGMALAATGDFTNAIISAQNALEFAPPANLKMTGHLRERLELYQKHEPWLESFSGTNAPAVN